MSCSMRCLLGLVLTINLSFGLELDEKCKKMFTVLEKKTESEFIFERFYNLFLEAHLSTDLEKFLNEKYTDTKDLKYLQLKASLFLRECENLKAIEVFDQLITDKSSAYIYYCRGKAYVSLLKLEAAIKDLTTALTKSPKSRLKIKITKLLGKIYIRQMNVSKGIETLLTIAEDGDDVAYHEIIDLMMAEGLYAEAQIELSKFIKSCKNKQKKVVLMLRQAELFRKQNLKEKSLDSFVNTLDHVGSGSWLEKEIFSQLEKVFRSEDDLNGLFKFYSTCLPNKKNSIELLKREAAVATELGKLSDAEELYKKIVKLTPSNKSSIVEYTKFLMRHGKNSKALTILQDLQQKNPTDGELLITLANLNFKMDEKAGCVDALKRYNSLKDGSEVALTRTATLLYKFGMFEDAEPVYKSLVEISPDNKDARLIYAFVLGQLKKSEEALTEYKTLAKTATIEQLRDIVTILIKNEQVVDAKSIIDSRQKDLSDSFQYQQLVKTLAMNQGDKALIQKSLLNMVTFATTHEELQEATYMTISIFGKENKLQELEQKLNSKGQSVNTRLLLAALYDFLENSAKRDQIIDELSKSEQSRVLALQSKLLFTTRAKKDKEVIVTLHELLEANPKSKIRYYKSLVDFYKKTDDEKNAFTTIEKWKIAAPNATGPYIAEANILRSGSTPNKAVELIKKVIFKFNKDENLASILINYLTEDGSYREAKSIYWNRLEEAEKVSDKLACIASLKQLCETDGSSDELKSQLEARLENNPQSIFLLLALANVCGQQDYDGRRYYLMRASDVRSDDIGMLQELARMDEEDGKYSSALGKLKQIYNKQKTVTAKNSLISFYYRNGDDEKANELLTTKDGEKTFTLDESISIAESLRGGDSDYLKEFLEPLLQKYPRDYRLLFLQYQAEFENGVKLDALFDIIKHTKPAPETKMNHYVSSDYYKSIYSKSALQILVNCINMNNYHNYNNRNRGPVVMPKDEAAAYNYAFMQISLAINTLNIDEQLEAFNKLEKAGVAYPELPYLLNYNRRTKPELYNKISEKYSDNKGFQEILLAQKINKRVKTQEELDLIIEDVKAKAPKLIPLLFHSYTTVKGKGPFIKDKKLVDSLVKQLLEEDLEKSHQLGRVVISLVKSDTISKETKVKLFDKLMESYNKQAKNNQNYYFEVSLLHLCSFLNKDREIAQILNNMAKKGNTNNYHHSRHYGGSNRPSRAINKQDFINTVFSYEIIRFMNEKIRNMSYGPANQQKFEIKRLAPYLSEIESPALKLFLAEKLNNNESCEKAIKLILDDEKSTAPALKLCASYFIEKKDYTKATEVIKVMISRTKLAKDKKGLYFSYFYYATKNKDQTPEMTNQMMVEFNKFKLSIADKAEILDYLIIMNDKKMVAELQSEIDSYLVKMKKSKNIRRYKTQNNSDARTRIRNLFEQKENKKAVALASREIRKLMRPLIVFTRRNNNSWQLKNILENVTRYGAEDELLALMKASVNESFSKSLIEVGLTYLFLGKKDEAIKYFEMVLKNDKNNKIVKFYLTILQEKEGYSREVITAMRKKYAMYEIIQRITTLLESLGDNDSRIKSIGALTKFVAEEKELDNNCYYQFMNAVNCRLRVGNYSIPDLHDPNPQINGDKKEIERLVKLRDKYAIEFLKVAITNKELAHRSFESLYVLLKKNNTPDADIFELAKVALNASLQAQYLHDGINPSKNSTYNGKKVEYKTAPGFILNYALQDPEKVMLYVDSLKNDHFGLGAKTKQISELVQLPESEFFSKSNELITKLDKNSTDKNALLGIVIKVHKYQKYTCDLTPLVLKRILDTIKVEYPHNRNYEFVTAFLNELRDAKAEKKLNSFYSTVMPAFTKVIAKWEEESSDVQLIRNNYNSRWYSLQELFRITFDNKDDSAALKSVADALSIEKSQLFTSFVMHNGNFDSRVREYYEKLVTDYNQVKKTKLVSSLDEFSAEPVYTRSSSEDSILAILTSKRSSLNKKSFLEELNKVEAKTFGQSLLITLLNAKKDSDVYKFLDLHYDAIVKLPEEKKQPLIDSLQQILVSNSYFSKDKECITKSKTLIVKPTVSLGADEELNQFIGKVIGHDEYSFRQQAKKLLKKWIVSKPDYAQRVLDTAVIKLYIYYVQNMNRYSSGSHDPIAGLFSDLRYGLPKEATRFLFKNIDKMKLTTAWRKNEFVKDLCYRMISDAGSKERLSAITELVKTVGELPETMDISTFACVKDVTRLDKDGMEKLMAIPELKDPKGRLKEIQVCIKTLYQLRYGSPREVSDDFCSYYTGYFENPKVQNGAKIYTIKLILDKCNIGKCSGDKLKMLYTMINVVSMNNNIDRDQLSRLYGSLAESIVKSHEDTPEWHKSADQVIKFLAQNKSHQLRGKTNQIMMLQLYLMKGKLELAKALVSTKMTQLQCYLETYLFFKFYGFEDEGILLCKNYLKRIDPTSNPSSCYNNHSHTTKEIDDFAQKLNLLGIEKYMADVSFAKLKRNSNSFKKLLPELVQWVKLLENRNKYILAFYNDSQTREEALTYASYIFKDFSPKSYLSTDDDQLKRMYANYLITNVPELSSERLTEISDEIVKFYMRTNNSYQIRYFTEKLSSYSKELLEKDRTLFADKKMVDFIGALISKSDYYYSMAEIIGSVTLALQLEKKDELMKTWLECFNEKRAKDIARRASNKVRPYLENLYKTDNNQYDRKLVDSTVASVQKVLEFKDSKKK